MACFTPKKRRELQSDLDRIGAIRREAISFLFELLWHDPHDPASDDQLRDLVVHLRKGLGEGMRLLESLADRYFAEIDPEAAGAVTDIALEMRRLNDAFLAEAHAAVSRTNMKDRAAVLAMSRALCASAFEGFLPGVVRSTSRISHVFADLEHASSRAAEARMNEAMDRISSLMAATKMVSINASIEAARAGQGGGGFAAIADEIRKLSEASGEALSEFRHSRHGGQ